MRISQLKILKGIPFNADDKVVITFDSIESQYLFFNKHTIATYNHTSFIRGFYNKKIKIDVDFSEVKYANYVMFKNDDLEDEGWNYAYITNIEYISDNCTHIEIEMDYFQTYMGQIVFGECSLERQMTYDDDPEYSSLWYEEPDLQVDNYLVTGYDEANFKNFKVCVCYKPNLILESLKDTTDIFAQKLEGNNQVNYRDYRAGGYSQYFNRGWYKPNTYVSGCAYRNYAIANQNDVVALTDDLWKLETLGYTILSVYVIPSEFDIEEVYQKTISLDKSKNPYYKSDKEIKIPGGYTPINNKCYTSPYMYLEVSNKQGDIRKYMYQYFRGLIGGDRYDFRIYGDFVNNCMATIIPITYKTDVNSSQITSADATYDYGIPIREMPKCQWNDSFANFAKATIGLMGDTIGAIATGGASLPASAGNLFKKVTGDVFDPSTKGVDAMPVLQLLMGLIGWTFRQYTTSKIMEIDEYFSKYGYAFNLQYKPNILGNRRFNYVKTKQAIIRGDIPINARNNIIDKLNNGITFWHDLTNFDYGDFRGIYSNEITGNDLTNRGTIF